MRGIFSSIYFFLTKPTHKKKSPGGYTIDPNNKCVYTNLYVEFISFSLYPIYHFILMGFKLFSLLPFFSNSIHTQTHTLCRYPLPYRSCKIFLGMRRVLQDSTIYKPVLRFHVYNIERHRFDC